MSKASGQAVSAQDLAGLEELTVAGDLYACVRLLELQRSTPIDTCNWTGPGGKRQCRCEFDGMTVDYGQQVAIPPSAASIVGPLAARLLPSSTPRWMFSNFSPLSCQFC